MTQHTDHRRGDRVPAKEPRGARTADRRSGHGNCVTADVASEPSIPPASPPPPPRAPSPASPPGARDPKGLDRPKGVKGRAASLSGGLPPTALPPPAPPPVTSTRPPSSTGMPTAPDDAPSTGVPGGAGLAGTSIRSGFAAPACDTGGALPCSTGRTARLGQASALTAIELTDPPNRDFGVWENGGKWGNGGHSTRGVGCGGLWRDVVEENGAKNGTKNATKCPFFTVPFSQFLRRSKIVPTVPSITTTSPPSLTAKRALLPLTAPHSHGAPCGCFAGGTSRRTHPYFGAKMDRAVEACCHF